MSEVTEKKQSFFSKALELFSFAIQPSLVVLVGVGMVKVVLMFLEMAGVLSSTDSTYVVLFNAADCAYYFLPIFVGYGTAKKLDCEGAIGMAVGAFLVAPGFVENVNNGVNMSVLGFDILPKSYSSSFLPPIICTVLTVYLYKFIEKHVPQVLRNLIAPMVTFLIMIPLIYTVLGPATSVLGDYIAVAVMWVYNHTGFIGVGVFAGILPFLTIAGMHWCFSPYWITVLATGTEYFYLISSMIFNVNAGIAALAVGVKTKNLDQKSLCTSAGVSSTVGGISEPALFGVILKYKAAMVGLITGSVVAGCLAGLLKVGASIWPGSWGIFMFTAFINSGKGLINCLLSVGVGIIVTFVTTYILYKDGKSE